MDFNLGDFVIQPQESNLVGVIREVQSKFVSVEWQTPENANRKPEETVRTWEKPSTLQLA